MIYVTGDMHGDPRYFRSKGMRKLKRHDTLIVCGDFGFLWDGSKKEKRLLKWIGRRKFQVLFVEGTHDNLDLLNEYPAENWHGGVSRVISGKLRHLERGHVYNIEGNTIFAFGGGLSAEREIRRTHGNWWHGELPTEEEIEKAWKNLASVDYNVDYIVTHQSSLKTKQFLAIAQHRDMTILDAFLDEVRQKVKYKRWFFGEIHRNKSIPPSEVALFGAVVSIESGRP